MANGRVKRKRQYHNTPVSVDIRVKAWKCVLFLAENAASGLAAFASYLLMLVRYLAYLNPLPVLKRARKSLFFKQRPRRQPTYQYYQAVTYKPSWVERLRNTLKSDRKLKQELMEWLGEKLPVTVGVADFREAWSDGVVLCALSEAVVPASCPRYDLLKPEHRVNNCRLGMTLIRKSLGIEEPMEPEEMADPSRASEKKLTRYIQLIRYASMVPVETPATKTGPWSKDGAWGKGGGAGDAVDEERKQLMEADKVDCTASGSGLVLATIGKRAKFNVYTPRFITKSLHINIRGPQGESVRRKIINHLPGGRPHRDDPDSSNQSGVSGGEDGTTSSSSFSSSAAAVSSKGGIPCEYQCVREGHYEVSYIPQSAGAYEIAVTWGGEHVRNSPFKAHSSEPESRSMPPDADPTRAVCFRKEAKRFNSSDGRGLPDDQPREGYPQSQPPNHFYDDEDNDQDLPSSATQPGEGENPRPNYNVRARRRQSFCRQSHVTALQESLDSISSASPYDSRCSSMLMSSTERSMDSDVFYPYHGGSSRGMPFMSASRRGMVSSSSSRSSMMSHRSSSILSDARDKPGTVRTRRKVIKRTIRGAGGKEEIQYPSSADMSSMSGYSSFLGMSTSTSTPHDQSSIGGSLSISDDRVTTGMSSCTSSVPSPVTVAPVPTVALAEREVHLFAERISKRLMGNVMYELSKQAALGLLNSTSSSRGPSEEPVSGTDLGVRSERSSSGYGDKDHRQLDSKKSNGIPSKYTDVRKDNSMANNSNKSNENVTPARNTQSPKFLAVADTPEGNKQVESQITIEFEPQLGNDSARNTKESSSNNSSTASAEREHVDEESGYSTLEESMRGFHQEQGLMSHHNQRGANKDAQNDFSSDEYTSAFEVRKQGFRPLNLNLGSDVNRGGSAGSHIVAPKPQKHVHKGCGQARNRRPVDRQTQCTADGIKNETGWVSRRSAFTKQKRKEQTEMSFERTRRDSSVSPQTTTTSPRLSEMDETLSQASAHVRRLDSKSSSVDKSTTSSVRQAAGAKQRAPSRSVGRQSTFDSGFSDENGHIYNLSGRDRSNSASRNKVGRSVNDHTVARVLGPSVPTISQLKKNISSSMENVSIQQFDDTAKLEGTHPRKRVQSASESARNQLLFDKSKTDVENMIEDQEIIAATIRRPSFTAINFDMAYLHHVMDSQDNDQENAHAALRSPSPTKQSQVRVPDVPISSEREIDHVVDQPMTETEHSSVLGDRRDDITDGASYEPTMASSNVSSIYGGYLTLKNDKEVPVSKLLASLDHDPDFTIREFLSKYMPILGEGLVPIPMSMAMINGGDDASRKEAQRLYSTLDALEQEMASSWSEVKSGIPSRAGADSNSKRSSRRQTPRVGTPFSSGAQSSAESLYSTTRPACCTAMGIGIHEGQVGVKNNFQVETSNAGEGSLAVMIRGPRPHTVSETSVTFTGDDLYEVVYEVTLAGFYVISVKWADKHIPESPFIVQISF